MAKSTEQAVDFDRGAFPAMGRKVGLIQVTLDLSGVANGDALTAITFDAPALVLAAGVEVVSPANASVTISLGDTEDGHEYVTTQDGTQAAGTQLTRDALSPVLKATDGELVLSVAGAAATTGSMRVWALVADVADLAG
jgi:hypothetical protein